MKRFCLLSAITVLVAGVPGPLAGQVDAIDGYGDPLPAGAMKRLGTVRLRQRQGVLGVAFTPDGTALASTGWGDSIRLWDVQTGKLIRRYRGTERNGTFAVAFSPDGKRMASAGEVGLVRLWDVASGKELFKARKGKGRVYGVAFAPDGHTFATADEVVRLWDVASGEELLDLQPSGRVRDTHAVVFSPDGKTLASGAGKTIHLWNLETGGQPIVIENAHGREVASLAFTPNGKTLISGGYRHEVSADRRRIVGHSEIRLWDVAGGRQLGQLQPEGPSLGNCTIAISKDGKVLVSKNYDCIRIWDVPSGRLRRTIHETPNRGGTRTHGVAISPSGKMIAARWGDHKVRLWDITTGRPLFEQAECHSDAVIAVRYSPDGKRIATGSEDGAVRLWDPANGRLVRALPPASGGVRCVLFSPDGDTIVASGEAHDDQTPAFVGAVRLFNAATGNLVRTIDLPNRAMAAAFSPDGKRLAVARGLGREAAGIVPDGLCEVVISIFQFPTGRRLAEFRGHEERVDQLAFFPDGKSLLSIGKDRTVRTWNLGEGKEEDKMVVTEYFQCASLTPDAKTLATGRSFRPEGDTYVGRIVVRDLVTRKQRATIEIPNRLFRSLAVSPDGRVLASYGRASSRSEDPFDDRIVLWDATTGRELLSFRLDDGRVRALDFSPDGKTLVSGMDRGTALIWDVAGAYNKLAD